MNKEQQIRQIISGMIGELVLGVPAIDVKKYVDIKTAAILDIFEGSTPTKEN